MAAVSLKSGRCSVSIPSGFLRCKGMPCLQLRKDGVFGRFDLAALGGCHTLNVCYVMMGTAPQSG